MSSSAQSDRASRMGSSVRPQRHFGQIAQTRGVFADQRVVRREFRLAADQAHLAEVESKIAGLTALKIELSATIDRCRSGTIAQCQILKALAAPADSNPR